MNVYALIMFLFYLDGYLLNVRVTTNNFWYKFDDVKYFMAVLL